MKSGPKVGCIGNIYCDFCLGSKKDCDLKKQELKVIRRKIRKRFDVFTCKYTYNINSDIF